MDNCWGKFMTFARITLVCCVAFSSVTACDSKDESLDAAIQDASTIDAVVECSMDVQCDDGLFCNGTESCSEAGLCLSGLPAECNDGIPCTVDLCSNETRACVSVAPDADEDGHGDASCLDDNGEALGDDCDDLDENRFPGNVEFCDAENHDEDCDTSTFGIVDVDVDGFASASCCNQVEGEETVCGNDCDDTRANINAFATEVCDGLDNNCDGEVDEGVLVEGFLDADSDGFGDSAMPLSQCAGLALFSTIGGDCDDGDVARHPGQIELCDNVDNDCDTDVDEDPQSVDWFVDEDGDGYGDPGQAAIVSCAPIAGRSIVDTDCDDDEAAIHPAAQELCDGIDNNCNGLADYKIGVNDYEDDDGDGLVDIACAPLGIDCDDTNPVTGPGTVEQCDGQDNDCDGEIDENVVSTLWFRDIDEDGYGSVTSGTLVSCEGPLGYSAAGGDCDDSDESRNPAIVEVCNGNDDDCDGAVDEIPAVSSCPMPDNAAPICDNGACSYTCGAAFAECNGDAQDGCEAELASDANHCGSCNTACNKDNQSGSCTAGACECSPGFSDCDGLAINGCEVNTDNDSDSCGSCGNICAYENASGLCVVGECQLQRCEDGFDDCDATPGCESMVTTDTQCGSCNNDCTTLANTSSFCSFDFGPPRCEVSGCDIGFQDCNGMNDGCETNLSNTDQNCGSCNNDCSFMNNSTGTCIAGACECDPGFLDCGMGCNVDIDNDTLNCGSCGNDCSLVISGAAKCNAGICEAECMGDFQNCDGDATTCDTNIGAIDNCGGCGTTCSASNGFAECQNFGGFYSCSVQCDFGFEDCDVDPSTCEIDRQNDPDNCGGCGNNCGIGGQCQNEACDQVQAITVGESFSCALRSSGNVVCWGDNSEGQLGNGDLLPAIGGNMPAQVDTTAIGQVTSLASGAKHSCAIGITGTYCWGDNTLGQLGSDTAGMPSSSPLLVAGSHAFISLAVGKSHSCGIDVNSDLYCWGDNGLGQLGQGAVGPGSSTPLLVGTWPANSISKVAAGDDFSCALTYSSELYCWGAGGEGQLGNGVAADSPTPVLIAGHSPIDFLSLGSLNACSLRNSGGTRILECWGDDGFMQIGNGNPSADEPSPTGTGLASGQELSLGAAHACMLSDFGSLYCWGGNSLGQGGQGNTVGPLLSGTQVQALGTSVLQIAQGTGANHVCVLTTNQMVTCWGSNDSGQAGMDPINMVVDTPSTIVGL